MPDLVTALLLKMENKQTPTKMEAQRKRKPLSDCTNTTTPISSSNKNPSLASAIKTLLNDVNGKSVTNSNSRFGSTAAATSVDEGEVASENPSSVAVASKPAKSSRVSVTCGRHEAVEPCSVYGRRSAAAKRKSKGKEVAMPVAGSPAASIKTASAGDKHKEDKDADQYKSCTTHHKKKRKDDKDYLKDFIEEHKFIKEQKAYFKEVDKFELLEEEVDSIDQLE